MPDSQYLEMIIKEEAYHAKSQIENSVHYIYKNLCIAENIFEKLRGMKFTAFSQTYSLQQAKDAFLAARFNEEIRSAIIIMERIDEIELEAKKAAGSSHRVKFECTYKK